MKVLVIGATGYIGTSVSEALVARGHEVVGLARSDAAAARLAAKGYGVLRGDMKDPASVARAAQEVDATIHVATTGDAENAKVDPELARAILSALEGTGKRFVYTAGIWGVGHTGERPVAEEDAVTPLPLVAWRDDVQAAVLAAASRGVRTVVVSPALVYGRGGGLARMLVDEARSQGRVRFVGEGLQEWTLVHVDDIADLYVRALDATPGTFVYGAAPGSFRARDIAVAASVAGGAGGRVESVTMAQATEAFGALAQALAVHQRVSGGKAERALGWRPRRHSVIEDLLAGSYRAD